MFVDILGFATRGSHCESQLYLRDDPACPAQLHKCPRQAETTRWSFRLCDRSKGEAPIVTSTVSLCGICAREWDRQVWGEDEISPSVPVVTQ